MRICDEYDAVLFKDVVLHDALMCAIIAGHVRYEHSDYTTVSYRLCIDADADKCNCKYGQDNFVSYHFVFVFYK